MVWYIAVKDMFNMGVRIMSETKLTTILWLLLFVQLGINLNQKMGLDHRTPPPDMEKVASMQAMLADNF